MNYWDRVSQNIQAYGAGLASTPMEAIKYPGLGANHIAHKLGLRNKKEAESAANAIKEFTDNPPFLSEAVQQYGQRLREQAPEMTSLGNIAGGAIGGQALAKQLGVSLTKNPQLWEQFSRLLKANPALISGGAAAFSEGVQEPIIDDLSKYGSR